MCITTRIVSSTDSVQVDRLYWRVSNISRYEARDVGRRPRTGDGQDALLAEIRKFIHPCGEVSSYWPQEELEAKLEVLRQIAALIGASCPAEAEDVALSLSLEQVGAYLHRLAVDPATLNQLRELRTALGAEGSLDEVLADAHEERSAHSLALCRAQANRCLRVLDTGRERWPVWEADRSKVLYERLSRYEACEKSDHRAHLGHDGGGIGHVRAADVHWMPLRVHVCVPCNPSDNHAAGQLGIRAADRPDGPLQQTVRARPPAWSPATRPATTRRAQS